MANDKADKNKPVTGGRIKKKVKTKKLYNNKSKKNKIIKKPTKKITKTSTKKVKKVDEKHENKKPV